MPNIVEYVKKFGTDSFAQRPFSVEDALVLCQFSYLKFDGLLKTMDSQPTSIKSLADSPDREKLFCDKRYVRERKNLLDYMVGSERFGGTELQFYVNRIDTEEETQFCAVTFFVPGYGYFVSFRGTDENIVGWQEDFQLALKKPFTGQKLSVEYLAEVASKIDGSFSVGGHSKGGNLAVYSAMKSADTVKSRIDRIYSFDGPGFRREFLEEYNYESVKDRVISVIPKSSIFGLLLSVDRETIVVMAHSIGPLQHNPYSWVLRKGQFVKREVTQTHMVFVNAFNEWVYSLNDEQLRRFVHALGEVLNATEAETTLEISSEFIKTVRKVFKRSKELDDRSKEFLDFMVSSYYDMTKVMVKSEVKKTMDGFSSEVKAMLEDFSAKAREIGNGSKKKNRRK